MLCMVFIHESKGIENEQVLVKAGNEPVKFFEAESLPSKAKISFDIIFISGTLHSQTKSL